MPYIVGAVIGAIIGYFTNWLAIKMLFKPRTEKRVAGIKVPFTPGLIPKEKERIAKSIAESVGEHLINQESVAKTLDKPEVRNKIKSAVNEKAKGVLNENGTLEKRLKDMLGDKYDEKSYIIEEKIYNKAISYVEDSKNQDKLKDYILSFIFKKLEEKPDFIIKCIKEVDLETLAVKLANVMESEKGEEFLVENLDKLIEDLKHSNKSINEVIPKQGLEMIQTIVYENKEKISDAIVTLLDDENISKKIKSVIIKDVLGAAGPLVAMFGGADTIYNKINIAVSLALSEEENQIAICNHLVKQIGKMTDGKVSDILEKFPQEISTDLAKGMTGRVSNALKSTENIEKFRETLISMVEKYDSYSQFISKFDENYDEKLYDIVEVSVKNICYSDDLRNGIKGFIASSKTEILSYDISSDNETKDSIMNAVSEVFDSQYNKFIEKDLQGVIEIIDIQSLVEEQINAFEVDEAEKIILGIASKELSAITWLGALLGGILGVLSPVLSSFYS